MPHPPRPLLVAKVAAKIVGQDLAEGSPKRSVAPLDAGESQIEPDLVGVDPLRRSPPPARAIFGANKDHRGTRRSPATTPVLTIGSSVLDRLKSFAIVMRLASRGTQRQPRPGHRRQSPDRAAGPVVKHLLRDIRTPGSLGAHLPVRARRAAGAVRSGGGGVPRGVFRWWNAKGGFLSLCDPATSWPATRWSRPVVRTAGQASSGATQSVWVDKREPFRGGINGQRTGFGWGCRRTVATEFWFVDRL
jgi:hypothetical protein